MINDIKNRAKSIRARLLNINKATGYDYMYLLSRYFNERLLYRVAVSEYSNHLVLKGGSLLYALEGLETRPTVDVDFMAAKISNNREWLEGVFREILSVPCTEDAVVFETDNLRSETITIDKKYPGIRFLITAQMDTIEHRMTIDVGFGDVVTPHPETIDFPLLLEDNTGFKLQSYTVESVIAEKFHTMIDRDVVNSRMKDFFDCYILLTSQHKTEDRLLRDAIYATFNNRNLKYNADLQLFTTSFSADELRLKRWSTFLKKIKWKEEIPFHEVMKVISDKLLPIYNDYWSDRNEV